jgi:hypothetical protein
MKKSHKAPQPLIIPFWQCTGDAQHHFDGDDPRANEVTPNGDRWCPDCDRYKRAFGPNRSDCRLIRRTAKVH